MVKSNEEEESPTTEGRSSDTGIIRPPSSLGRLGAAAASAKMPIKITLYHKGSFIYHSTQYLNIALRIEPLSFIYYSLYSFCCIHTTRSVLILLMISHYSLYSSPISVLFLATILQSPSFQGLREAEAFPVLRLLCELLLPPPCKTIPETAPGDIIYSFLCSSVIQKFMLVVSFLLSVFFCFNIFFVILFYTIFLC